MISIAGITVQIESSLGNLGRVSGALPDARPAFFTL